jgi:hypothetical protein
MGIRTPGLRYAKPPLYQLSYDPMKVKVIYAACSSVQTERLINFS